MFACCRNPIVDNIFGWLASSSGSGRRTRVREGGLFIIIIFCGKYKSPLIHPPLLTDGNQFDPCDYYQLPRAVSYFQPPRTLL